VTSESVREYLTAMRRRYQDAPKATKSRLLDEVCAVTGHHPRPHPPPAPRSGGAAGAPAGLCARHRAGAS
jgi:hypothetical protein